MVTKRTRLLSIVTTAIMLVSMFACFVIPASAETADLDALKAKYDILDPANFEGLEGTPIEDMRADIAEYISQYNAAVEAGDTGTADAVLESAVFADEETSALLTGKVKADVELRYGIKGYYEALGYPTEGVPSYLISTYEDWQAAAIDAKNWSGVTLKLTADIDFTGKTASPLTGACTDKGSPEYDFKGTLDGQGHKLINMNLSLTGCYAGAVVGYSRGGVIKNLGIEGGTLAYTRGGADWYSVGSFAGNVGNFKLLNCWSTMAISGANADGKTGTAGLIGMGESSVVIDNCFFAGSVNNTAGPATDTVGYGGGVSGTDIYNTIGAGTLVAATNPVAMGGWHSNLWGDKNVSTGVDDTDTFTGEMAETDRLVIHNSYAVGHDSIRFRGNAAPISQKNATYFGEAYAVDTLNAIHSAASLKEAAWKVNSNFDNAAQEEQTYFFDVDANGKLCFTTDANATLKQVTIEIVDGATDVFYLHPGDEVNLVDDLGLKSQIESIEVTAGYESAVVDKVLTVPNADITLTVTYDEAAILESAIDELKAVMAKYEAIDFALFTSEDEMVEWYEYAQEGIELEDIDQIADAITWETELEVELKEGVYPPFEKYDAYKAFAPAAWGISSKADWLAAVEKTTATDGTAANFLDLDFHVTEDIDFEDTPMAPLAWGAIFTGSLNGHGKVFKRINITNPAADAGKEKYGVGLIAKVNGVVIRDLGIESGEVTSSVTTTYAGPTGAFVGIQDGALEVYNCWNGANVTATTNKYGTAAGLVGSCENKALKVVGFYNLGDLTGSSTNGVAAAVWGSGTSHGLTIAAHIYNAGTLTGANTRLWRANISAGYPARNYITNDAVYLIDTNYCNAGDEEAAATRWDAGIVLEEDNGLYGYTLNKRATGITDKSGNAVPAVYWTVENGVSIFGTEANQTRKVTFTGSILGDRYYATGEEVTLSDIAAGAEYTVATAGYESAISNGVLTVPAADITINVTGDVVDTDAYIAAKAELEALTAKIAQMDMDLLADGAALGTLKGKIDVALAADAADSTTTTKNAIIALGLEAESVNFSLAEGKYVPYSKKDIYSDCIDSTYKDWAIAEPADWVAATNALNGVNSDANFHFTNDIVFDGETNVYPLCFGANYTGTIDGQNHVIKNIKIEHERKGTDVNSVALVSRGGCVIKNLGIASGSIYGSGTTEDTAHVAGFLGSSGTGAQILNCWNGATIKADFGKLHNGEGMHVAGIIAKANNEPTIKNCFNVGTIIGTVDADGLIGGAGKQYTAANLINIGTVTADSAAAAGQHGNLTNASQIPVNSYSVGVPFFATSNGGAWVSTEHTMDDYNAAAAAESAGEAAYKVNAGANGAVYYKLDDTYGLAFGDADNYVRKITISGTVNRVIYANNGQVIDLTTYADADYVVATEGYESALSGKVLTVPAADITITSSGNAIDMESYTTGKANLIALQEKLAGFDMALFANADAIIELRDDIDAALAADETSDDTTKAAIIALAAEADAFTYTLAEGKYVPYSKKDTVYSVVPANSNYGIYEAADWADFVAAGANTGLTVHLMNNVTLDASAPIFGASTFTGTFDGHDNTLTVAVTATVPAGKKFGIFGNGAATIKNLKVAGSVTYTLGTPDAFATAETFMGIVSGNGATLDRITNEATYNVTMYCTVRSWVGTILGALGTVTNCTNNGAVNVYGACVAMYVGGIQGRSNSSTPITNCVNNGAITVENDEAKTPYNYYTYVGGISGGSAGTAPTDCKNTGAITVRNASRAVVGGIYGCGSGDDRTLGGTIINEGAIDVAIAKKGDVCRVGGLFGADMWPLAAGATIENRGDIRADGCNAQNGFDIGGIAATLSTRVTAGFAATNSGDIWVGGNHEQFATVNGFVAVSSYEITGTNTGTITKCAHSETTPTTDVENKKHTIDCDACSYYVTADCGLTFTANDDLAVVEGVIVATHSATCAGCGHTYTENCVPVDDDADGTYTFDCCDREDYTLSGSEADDAIYAEAKAALEAIVAKLSALKAELFTNGADMTAALNAANAVLEADAAESTGDTKQAIIDEAAKEDVVPVLKSDAKVPYSKKALYAEYGASATVFGIYEAADWLAIVSDNAGGNEYYVMNNVDFSEVDSMLPLGYNGNTGLTGLLDGQGHAFLNINIVAGRSTNWRTGVSLVAGMNGGTIRNLGLTGNVTNTCTDATFADGSNTRTVLTAAFSAGKNNGAAWTIENCWSDVHVKGPSTAIAGLAVFSSWATANDTIRNCVNYGTVESTTNGSAAVFYSAASAAAPTSNCINLGDFITTGPAAAVILHSNQASLYTNNYSVGTNNVYLRDSATYDNANMVETAGEAAWKATNGANNAVYYKLDADKGVAYGTATDRVQKVEFTGDVEKIVYLNNGSTITLADVAEDATFSIEGTPIDGATYTVPNADVTITVTDNTPDCEHNLGETNWVDGTKTHIFVCGECGETVGEAESCEDGLVWAEDTGAKTHSATCSECGHTYTEDCQGTEKSNAADCTADHWMDYDCDRADEILPGTGANAHVWGDWTTEGAADGYRIHECENCDASEQELLPLAAPVIVITTNIGKAGQTGVNFTVTLTEAGIKSGTVTIALPAWAENVNLVAGTNVTIDGMVATITGNIAAGSELLTGTYDIDHLAGEAGTITATAANVLNEREESVDVAVATANAEIDVILGDAKVDGAVNLIDAIAVLRAVAGLDNDVNVANGDVDHSNGLSVDDAILIVRWWLEDPDYTGDNLGE